MLMSANLSPKVATKHYFMDKKPWKFTFLGCCSKAKMEEPNQTKLSFFNKKEC